MPSTRPAPVELLAALAPVVAQWGNRWYVFGAQAVLVWGAPRLTADVDVTVQLIPQDPAGFVRSMQGAGFDVRVSDVNDFLARTHVLPFLHPETGLPLDVILASPGLEEEFLSRAVTVEIQPRRAGLRL